MALQAVHRIELANMEARVMHYRALLEEHGVRVDDNEDPMVRWSGDDHFTGCVEIVTLAHDLMDAVDAFRGRLGSAKEMLQEQWT